MTEFRGDKMSLFLFLLLQFTAVTGQRSLRVVVRVGDEVTLPCINGTDHQDTCDRTAWLFNHQGSSSVNLATDGKIKENLKSDRLNVKENCSLLIKKVTVEDVGNYTCRQSGYDTYVYLFLITITEQDNDKKTLSCSMLGYGACDFTMSWIYKGEVVAEAKDMCSVTTTFPASYFKQKSKYESFKCKVRHPHDTEDHQFSFSPEKPGVEATTTTAATTTTTLTARASEDSNKTRTSSTEPANDGFSCWWRLIFGSVGLTTLIITVVAMNIWIRTKGNKTQTDDNAVHYHVDEDDETVNYENDGDPSASVRLH